MIALDATLILCSGNGDRRLSIDKFFLDYRKTDLKKGEFIKAIYIPNLGTNQKFRTYKISKRYDQDISSIIGAYRIEFDGETLSEVRIAYGGMSATPKRGKKCEAALVGKPWNMETLRLASSQVPEDFTPISDFRGSRDYRLEVASNLFDRLYEDIESPENIIEVMNL